MYTNSVQVAGHDRDGFCGQRGPLHLPVHAGHQGLPVYKHHIIGEQVGDVADQERGCHQAGNDPLLHEGASVPQRRVGMCGSGGPLNSDGTGAGGDLRGD